MYKQTLGQTRKLLISKWTWWKQNKEGHHGQKLNSWEQQNDYGTVQFLAFCDTLGKRQGIVTGQDEDGQQ